MTKKDTEFIDIRRSYFYLNLHGVTFSPKKTEKETGLTLHMKMEKGMPDLLEFPRHPDCGKPSNSGSAILQAPPQVPEGNQEQWILKTVRQHWRTFRRLGATRMTFRAVHFMRRDAQKNFELSVADMAILARAKVPFCLSVYHPRRKEIDGMPERYCDRLWKYEDRNTQPANPPSSLRRETQSSKR